MMITCSALVVTIASFGIAQAAPTPTEMGRSVAPLVERVKDAVVTIRSTKTIRRAVRADPFTQYMRERFGLGGAEARPTPRPSRASARVSSSTRAAWC